uniref:transglutaminase-like domain-containing protein n=1 Tax=Acetatifactor sp. TaxID=1872090 RepID=UPI00405624ED
MKKQKLYRLTTSYLLLTGLLTGCGQASEPLIQSPPVIQESITPDMDPETVPGDSAIVDALPTTLRDNTPICLVPTADGIVETHNDVAMIDYSNASKGYVCANYTGTCPKVKLRITGPDNIVYTYDLHGGGYETFPLSSGNGNYNVTIYENISGNNYSTCLFAEVSVELEDEFTVFLYPNQYVNFNAESETVAKGMELASTAENDLDVVTNIYDYITSTIIYDYDKASDPPTGYTTDVDEILNSGTGICLDYAAVMASMLRSQRIPTRLEVGYAQDAYHAWISVYIEEVGWLNGIIEFDGNTWTLVDPTFGANTDDKTLRKFIGDGSNYILQKMY